MNSLDMDPGLDNEPVWVAAHSTKGIFTQVAHIKAPQRPEQSGPQSVVGCSDKELYRR